MNAKKGTILFRCFINLLVGMLASFLVVSAFAAVTTVEGTSNRYMVGTKGYENRSLLQYISTSTDGLFGSTQISSLSGVCPVKGIGAKCTIYGQISGVSTRVSESKWLYNSIETEGVVQMTTYMNPPNGYYMCLGSTAVYYNNAYHESSTYSTPFIDIE